jgi:lysozyme family protein
VRYIVFDAAVNSGCKQSAMWLQQAVGANQDGVIGPKTLAAVAATPNLKSKLLAQRLRFMANLPTWPAFGRGWARRIAALMEMT